MSNRRDPLVTFGLAVIALAAAVSSFSALYGVAMSAGWTRDMAPMFPITIDATAMVSTRIWLAGNTATDAARRYARTVAVGSVIVSLLGNAAYHLTEAGVIHPGVVLVIAAGAVPPIALAVVAHLAVLRGAEPVEESAFEVPEQVAEMIAKTPEIPAPTPTPIAPARVPQKPVNAPPEPVRVPVPRPRQPVTQPRQTAVPRDG
ncbi:MAG TPA: DUF2637 domain-containing protein [Actinocrinis sp.]|uniref:DUF2637 domain-containing protein n=1 Tax=Actinocrinis sp. TaxID=1920516 RepID=UPI002DDD15C2|nr:DUF2637 domain-containing protein [Actinocrinis sp.]HEV2344359.1 DUF2637 domain-containing protein [Actinocrinis sp.]